MDTISITGILTEDGRVEVTLPEGWRAGEIRLEIQIEPVFTEQEVNDMIQFHPKPASEIQTGGWEDVDIDKIFDFKGTTLGEIDPSLLGAGSDWDIGDSVLFVENLRQQRRNERQ